MFPQIFLNEPKLKVAYEQASPIGEEDRGRRSVQDSES